jgi:ribosomal protein S18 acetylase RimI-like enzyme
MHEPASTPADSLVSRVTIRPLAAADAEAFRAIRLRALREEPAAFDATEDAEATIALEDFPKEFGFGGDAQESFVLGAFLPDDTLVGCVGGVRDDNPKRHHRALIWGMYVAAEHRGRGIGRALLEETLARIGRWEGLESVRLGVIVPNEPARRLYASFGFETIWVEPEAYKTAEGYRAVELMRWKVH